MTYRILVIIIVSIFLVFGCKSEEKKSPEKPPIFQQKIKTDLENFVMKIKLMFVFKKQNGEKRKYF